MSATAPSTTRGVGVDHSPASAFTSVLDAAIGGAAAKLEQHVGGWADKLNGVASGGDSSGGLAGLADEGLDELAEGGGAKRKAGAEGVRAGLHGENPVWAAIKGAWQGGSSAVRAAIVTAAVSAGLLLLLSPVLLLVFLLSLLIIAAVHRARAAASCPPHRAEQGGPGVPQVDGEAVQVGVCIRGAQPTGADHNHAFGTKLESRSEWRSTAGGAVDVPPRGLGGVVDMHGGEQHRDRRRGHQVGDIEPGGDEAPVVLGRRAPGQGSRTR